MFSADTDIMLLPPYLPLMHICKGYHSTLLGGTRSWPIMPIMPVHWKLLILHLHFHCRIIAKVNVYVYLKFGPNSNSN